jgi:hypothetical protein
MPDDAVTFDTRDRDIALLKAGIDPDNDAAQLIVNGWRPEQTPEQLRAWGQSLGVIGGTTPAADPGPAVDSVPAAGPAQTWATLPDGTKVLVVGDMPQTITVPGPVSTTQINQPQQVPLTPMTDARGILVGSQNQGPPTGVDDPMENPHVKGRRQAIKVKQRGGSGIDAVAENLKVLREAAARGDRRVIQEDFNAVTGEQPRDWDIVRIQRRGVGTGMDLITGDSGF